MLSTMNKPAEIKVGAAELASVFSDVLDAIKSAPTAYKQMVEEHKALKETKISHQKILDDNVRILIENKAERVTWLNEQKKENEAREKALKEIANSNSALDSKATSLNVRDTALGELEKRLKEKKQVLESKEKDQSEKASDLEKREKELRNLVEKMAKEQSDWRAKQEKLKEVMG